MADQKITQLTALPEASLAANDVLPIADITASETKKITAKDLVEGGIALADSGSIDLIKLNQSSTTKLSTTALADDAVTAAKLANNSSVSVGVSAPVADNFDGRGYYNSSTGVLQVYSAGSYATVAATVGTGAVDTAQLADGAVTTAKIDAAGLSDAALASNSVTTAKIADEAVTAAKIASNSITATQIAADAVGASELANDAVDTDAIVNLAVTESKLGVGSVTTDKLGTSAVTNDKIADTTITYAKLNLDDDTIPGAKIATDSITNSEIGPVAVGTSELIDSAVTAEKIATGAVTSSKIGAGAVNDTAIATAAVTGAKVADSAITYAKLQNTSTTDVVLGRSSAGGGIVQEISLTAAGRALLDDADAAAQRTTLGLGNIATGTGTWTNGSSFAGTSSGTNTGDQTITLTGDVTGTGTGSFAASIAASAVTESKLATDAVTTAKINNAAVTAAKMADNSGVVVSAGEPVGSGAFVGQQLINTNTGFEYTWTGSEWQRLHGISTIAISDSTPLAFAVSYPDDFSANIGVTLDTQAASAVFIGPTTGANAAPTFRTLVPGDLPDATASAKGIIQPGTGLGVSAGVLNHSNSTAGATVNGITFDNEGHITAATALIPSNIPSLDASKITTGTFGTALIADDAVLGTKLGDYSTAQFGETLPVAEYIGQFFFNPLDKNIYLWDGNVWQPVGVSIGELILGGIYDASVNQVSSTTSAGAAAGLTAGDPLPAASSTFTSYYVVVSESGTGTAPAPTVALAPPDIILCDGGAWREIDVSSTYTAQTASNVGFVPAGTISSTNVQTAVEEVATEAANAANLTSGVVAVARGGTALSSYTKGDLLAASASTTLTKLGVGTNGQVLKANSATATGLEWGTAASGTVTNVTSSTGALTVATSTTTPALTIRAATTSVDGIVQLSDSTSTTSSVLAATPTAVKAAYDLAAAALPKAGGVVTGALEIGSTGSLVFEGATDDGFETTLAVADATADRTLTLPNVTGTLISTGDTGTVTSTMIANDTITNDDVNTGAAIAYSKLASLSAGNIVLGNASNVATSTSVTGDVTINNTGVTAIASGVIVDNDINAFAEIGVSKLANGTARQLLQTDAAGTGVEWASNIDVPGTLDVTSAATFDSSVTVASNVTLNAQADLRFADADSSNWVAFQAPTTVASNVTWTLPAADGSASQVLQTNGTGTLSWVTPSGGGSGDVVLASNNAFTGANTFTNATGQIFRSAATQDGILLRGRAGGTTSRTIEIIPATLSASRVLTAPNVDGTIVTTGDTGSVNSTMILDGTIVNADINASAAIADTKLATINTIGKVNGNAISFGTIGGSTSIDTTGTVEVGAGTVASPSLRLGNGGPGLSGTASALVFSLGSTGVEKARLTSGTFSAGDNASGSYSSNSVKIGDAGVIAQVTSAAVGSFRRDTTDGTLISFKQDTTEEGTISVNGTTISYNGAHLSRWSQVIDADPHNIEDRPTILRGTVMSNLDEMCEWIDPDTGEIQANEQLNKTKVSDMESDANVAGIFQAWDDDDDIWVNDYYLAMTGDFVIRIAAGVTVERGDLLESAGDGTARSQIDDIIRSRTIAKVTSTVASCTYEDGSYCVPCVLMAC